jgi:hypothetical protein
MNTATQPNYGHTTVLSKLDAIEKALLANDPLLPYHCKEVLKLLQEQEELIHLLDDKQRSILIGGMKTYQNIQLVTAATKSAGKKKITADDL